MTFRVVRDVLDTLLSPAGDHAKFLALWSQNYPARIQEYLAHKKLPPPRTLQ